MDWSLNNLSPHCMQCGYEFREGETVCSAVLESGDSFERRDFCENCDGDRPVAEIYAHWRTILPRKEAPSLRKAVNAEAVREFFDKLAGEEDRNKRNFRYVLALLLMRRKTLRFVSVRRGEGGEELILRDPKTDQEHVVYNPQLAEDEILALTAEVGKVLNVDVVINTPPVAQEESQTPSP
jgi:hypothetical protein